MHSCTASAVADAPGRQDDNGGVPRGRPRRTPYEEEEAALIGDILWTPPEDLLTTTEVGRFMRWLRDERGLEFDGYPQLRRWSVEDLAGFWGAVWDFFGVRAETPYERVLGRQEMPGAEWFPGARLNYAEHLFGTDEDTDRPAIVAENQTRAPEELTFGELRERVARARSGLKALGVGPGDRVVGYLPNVPETVIAFIATASLGAIWATCAPEFGARSVLSRFAQISPKVLFTVGGYGFRDRYIDRRHEVAEIVSGLKSLEHVVSVDYGAAEVPDALPWDEFLARDPEPLAFEPVPFDHPLYVLFSSGTTGLPKAIVHGHGGMLLEHLKSHALIWDLKPEGRLLQFTTTAWMMWNALVSALLLRSSIVLLDGDPGWPQIDQMWRWAERYRPSVMSVSPPYLMACRKAGVDLRELDLSSIRALVTAGSPLPAEGYRWVYEQLPAQPVLINGSGGTDVCTGLVSGSFALPVYEGEIAGACLGVDAQAFDEDGRPVVGRRGELVITKPMPSMPVGLWGDEDGERYRASYFDRWPGVWRQGDWISFTEYGSCVLSGRSDATLNRGGVRLGSGEFYAVVEDLPEIVDALVLHLEDPAGGMGELLLFVVPAPGVELDDTLRAKIVAALRSELSPRHVPDRITAVAAIPRTLTGKKLETPVKRILRGEPPEAVASRDALVDPDALDAFVELAAEQQQTPV